MKHLKLALLAFAAIILTSCSDETTFNDNEKGRPINEKIQSLKNAKSAEDIRAVYEYIVTEEDFSDAIEILTENNKVHLLENLNIEEPQNITLRSGVVVERNDDNEYFYQGDIRLTQEQLDILENPDINATPFTIDKENSMESIYAYMAEKLPGVQLPDFDNIKKIVEEYENNNNNTEHSLSTRGAALIVVPCTFGGLWEVNCPYVISSSFTTTERQFIVNAINTWNSNSSVTGITLKQRTNEKDYVEFVYGTTNSSNVGRKGGRQTITLISNGFSAGTAMHEIGHAFGLLHEHSKENRDKHINVISQNILDGKAHNFTRQATNCAQFDTFDYGSVMMYSSDTFSKNGAPTLRRKDNSTWIAQRVRLSTDDINIIPKMREWSIAATFVWIMSGGMG